MANVSNISLPRAKYMKCRKEIGILMSSCILRLVAIGNCDHKFCQRCFRNKNRNLSPSLPYGHILFNCPCCRTRIYEDMESLDEAILFGEAATLRTNVTTQLFLSADVEILVENVMRINEANKSVIKKLDEALLLNPTNFYTLYLQFLCGIDGLSFILDHKATNDQKEFYRLKLFDCSHRLLDHPALPKRGSEVLRKEYCYQLACIFCVYQNFPAALKYAKLAYENCLKSCNHSKLSSFKSLYLDSRAAYDKLPPLRFAVEDEVKFLHESETGSEWKRARSWSCTIRRESSRFTLVLRISCS